MLRAAREQWRRARSLPVVRPLVEAADRTWWARVIRRSGVVDVEFAAAQLGRPVSARQAVRAYVRGGHATGLSLNPLACERTIARQLPEQDRVPALYAYLVNARGGMELSPNWDAAAYDDLHPDAVDDPAGTLGHAWRAARASGKIELGRGARVATFAWDAVHRCAVGAARAAHSWPRSATPRRAESGLRDARIHLVMIIAADEAFSDEALSTAAEATDALGSATVVVVTPGTDDTVHADTWAQCSLLALWHPGIDVALQAGEDPVEWVRNASGGDETDGVVILRGPGERIDANGLVQLAHAGVAGPISPLALSADGLVCSAGVITHGALSVHLLDGFPAEDARALGEIITVAGHGAVTRALPRHVSTSAVKTLLTVSVIAESAPPAVRSTDEESDLDALLTPSSLRLERWTRSGPLLVRPPREVRLDNEHRRSRSSVGDQDRGSGRPGGTGLG